MKVCQRWSRRVTPRVRSASASMTGGGSNSGRQRQRREGTWRYGSLRARTCPSRSPVLSVCVRVGRGALDGRVGRSLASSVAGPMRVRPSRDAARAHFRNGTQNKGECGHSIVWHAADMSPHTCHVGPAPLPPSSLRSVVHVRRSHPRAAAGVARDETRRGAAALPDATTISPTRNRHHEERPPTQGTDARALEGGGGDTRHTHQRALTHSSSLPAALVVALRAVRRARRLVAAPPHWAVAVSCRRDPTARRSEPPPTPPRHARTSHAHVLVGRHEYPTGACVSSNSHR